MKTVYDVQQLLKKFGTFVYTGDRIGDLELMEMDIDELYQMEFIQTEVFQLAKLILRKEKRQLQETKRRLYTWQITLSE
ncbi:YqgQ family protein [Virgibacillus halotolerans]|uniref:YqgQ family protein n=1 Tax=Virgibacillus halotolerans TaxID=1071053 RepID=UPI00195F55B7|nr:YqgQ family protein [Virgibacillus halotolerans]